MGEGREREGERGREREKKKRERQGGEKKGSGPIRGTQIQGLEHDVLSVG